MQETTGTEAKIYIVTVFSLRGNSGRHFHLVGPAGTSQVSQFLLIKLSMPDSKQPPQTKKPSSFSDQGLAGLSPLGLMDGVLGGRATDWDPPPAGSLEPFFQGYTDFRYIDRGGMGAVYSAVQTSLRRQVAIKILPPELVDDEGFMERFQQEAHMLARLQHPHIIAVYDFGITQGGHHFIVMEYVEGVSLLAIIRRETLTASRALTITAQVCEALSYAHQRGVVHRDIKPSNILIDDRGQVRVADFGLAKNSRLPGATSTSQHTRGFFGTAGYAAPEHRQKDITPDHRSDLFSLGVTLYEMLTGQLPAGVFDPPSKKCGTPAHVDKIIRRALMQNPGERYQNAQEMRTALASSLLRMGTPLVQRAIISKPITSMVTCVIVGMGLIYLLDTLNNELVLNRQHHHPEEIVNGASRAGQPDPSASIITLSPEWAILDIRTRWNHVPEVMARLPEWTFAEIYSESEITEVSRLISARKIETPLWIAGHAPLDDGRRSFAWLSTRPMNFQAWVAGVPPKNGLIITEIQAKNATTLTADGETPDWIEVTNTSSVPIDITGYHLRQVITQENTKRYYLQDWLTADRRPDGQSPILQPGERRVLVCSNHATDARGHMFIDFSLEATGARLQWCEPRGHMCQNFQAPWRSFPSDASIGLAPDKESWGWCEKATPGAENSAVLSHFPAPSSGSEDPQGLMILPDFGCRWSSSPQQLAKPALLRRKVPQSP